MIQLNSLCKSYDGRVAADGITLEIADGETFGLLGPNGAGKSTAINIMVGVLTPDAGTVTINGEAHYAGSRRDIGVAPQSLAVYEELSAAENLAFFARLYGLTGKKLRDRVAWSLEFAGLTERCRDRVKTFSGGMKRRLNLAIALVHEPRVIFLDEPTVGVDPQSRNHIFNRIEQLKAAGRTIVYTTHYMEEAQRLCDRIAIMDRGRVLALDAVDRLIAQAGGRSIVNACLAKPPEHLAGLTASLVGLNLRFESDWPLEDVARLTRAGVQFQSLEVKRPDLETVFLNLTGRSLRD